MYHLNLIRSRQGQSGGTARPPDSETVDLTEVDNAAAFAHYYDAETGK